MTAITLLLTGVNGQVGHALKPALGSVGDVIAIGRAECDLTDEAALRSLLRRVRPQVIVNPAAFTAVDRAETERDAAFAVNARVPAILGEEAERTGALVVHYSTDYVFDGTKSEGHTEQDVPRPINEYGASKLAGEQALQRSGARHLILRTSWVYGVCGANFPKTMLRLSGERDELRVVADQFGTPTPASLLADVTVRLVLAACQDQSETTARFPYGLYHVAPSGRTNWHEYACFVIDRARSSGMQIKVPPEAILAVTSEQYVTAARRPANSLLDCTKLGATFGIALPDWKTALDPVLAQILEDRQ